jgi:hypothetical protein
VATTFCCSTDAAGNEVGRKTLPRLGRPLVQGLYAELRERLLLPTMMGGGAVERCALK